MEQYTKGGFEAAGYLFQTAADAKLAESEKKKVEYLAEHLDYSHPDTILALYKKAVSERIFSTPVGIEFLRQLQRYLVQEAGYSLEDVPPVYIYQRIDGPLPGKNRGKKKGQREMSSGFRVSVLLNVILLLAVAAMFIITLKSDNPNILNYESNLIDRYSYWEQDLTRREQAVKAKELELFRNEEEPLQDISLGE